jgi:uncharacterized protein
MGNRSADAQRPAGPSRRSLLVALGGLALTTTDGPLGHALGGSAVSVEVGPYGPLEAPDLNGMQLPAGFTAREIARSGVEVARCGYVWHVAPDGAACFSRPNGGWVYVSNSEVTDGLGGAASIEFDRSGTIVAAGSILAGTSFNCSGGATPWNTWLSCEETATGLVWECDPVGKRPARALPALGRFLHEAAAVDPRTGEVYLSEDDPAGRLYRFRPRHPGDLREGSLSAAQVVDGRLQWLPADPTKPDRQDATTPFNGGEGLWVERRLLYFTSKGDKRVWRIDLDKQRITLLFDGEIAPSRALNAVDNVMVHRRSADVFVAEDGGNMELCMLSRHHRTQRLTVAPFLRLLGHDTSEVTGPAFNPSGDRLYVSSQRGADGTTGVTYEIRGPFRTRQNRFRTLP